MTMVYFLKIIVIVGALTGCRWHLCRAIRHPASGYVQGINDLATPFIVVFLSEYLENDLDSWDLTKLSTDIMSKVSLT